MDFIHDDKLELADKLVADLWELCDQRLDLQNEQGPPTVQEFNVRIAEAINTLCQAYMMVNLIDSETPTEPKGFVSYSKQVKSE